MVHFEVYLNKYVVSIAPFSTSACPDCSQNIQKTAVFFACFRFLIFNPFSRGGGQLTPFATMCGRPWCGRLWHDYNGFSRNCIWPSWCQCHSLYLASVKSRLVLPFWYRLTRVVVPEKGPLNGCVCRPLFMSSPVQYLFIIYFTVIWGKLNKGMYSCMNELFRICKWLKQSVKAFQISAIMNRKGKIGDSDI